jgi:hypothetical protein
MAIVRLIAITALAMQVATPTQAHHSNVAFDVETVKQIQGTVKQFDWMNPHIWITLVVTSDGAYDEWRLEGRPPSILARAGWSKDTIHRGDKITIFYSPAKDGTHTGLIARVTRADGTNLANAPREP